ncbi:hypothetical protein ACOI1H_24410, partial [Loktanella sp. DJP18]
MTKDCHPIMGSNVTGFMHAISGAISILFATQAIADGTFFQADASGLTSGLTIGINRGELTYGGGAVQYDSGYAVGLNATYRLPLRTENVTWRIGPSLGTTHDAGQPGPIDLG